MEPEPAVIASLRRAVAAMPDDLTLRLHLASLLLDAGQRQESIRHLGAIVHADPANAEALALLQRATAGPGPAAPASGASGTPGAAGVTGGAEVTGGAGPADAAGTGAVGGAGAVGGEDAPEAAAAGGGGEEGARPGFDWAEAEAELRDVLPPMFVTADGASAEEPGYAPRPTPTTPSGRGLRLADVAGMAEVKARLEAAFLAPLRNPELRRLYHKSLRGGLLLYGPPGCGKTFIARAVAGELGARFLAVSFADVVDMYIGQSERNIRRAVRHRPEQGAVRAVPGRGGRDRAEAQPAAQRADAQRGQPAAAGAGRRDRQQRGRVRAGGQQPPVGRGQRAAPAGPVRPDAAGAAAGRGRPARPCSGSTCGTGRWRASS